MCDSNKAFVSVDCLMMVSFAVMVCVIWCYCKFVLMVMWYVLRWCGLFCVGVFCGGKWVLLCK